MKKKITWTLMAIVISCWSLKSQSGCVDLNGFVDSKNTNGTSSYHLELGAEEYAGQTYHLTESAIISSVKIHGTYPGVGGGVPLRLSVCNVDANGRPTSVIKLINFIWWKHMNSNGFLKVNFPRGGVYVDDDFAITIQVLNDTPFGNAFDLKYTGDGDGQGQDLSSLAGISTGFNWASANQTFGKDGDFYLEPEVKHVINSNFDLSSRCVSTGTTVQFVNNSIVNKDSMFNRIQLNNYDGSNFIYNWNFGDGSTISHLENPSHTYSTAGVYTVTLTCKIDGWQMVCSKTISKTISVGLNLGISNITNVSCYGSANGSVTLQASGGASNYLYSKDGIIYQNSNSFTGLNSGNYIFYVKDNLGCIKTINATINQPASIQFTTMNSTNASCGQADGSILVGASGGTPPYLYKINSGSYQSSGSFANLSIGVYMVTVKDANQCTKIIPIVVNDLGGPQISSVNSTQISCFAGNDGSISITSNGGTGNVNYSIDGGINYQSNTSFTNLAAGIYHIIVKDAAQCTDITTIALQQPNKLVMNIETVSALCNNSADGQISVVSTSGGIGSHSYSLNGTYYQSNDVFTGLHAGIYTVFLKDVANCIIIDTVTVGEPPAVELISTSVPVTCNGEYNGAINNFVSGGTGEYHFSINNGIYYQDNYQFNNLNAGTYIVFVKDDNNCIQRDTIIVGGEGSYQYSLDGVNYNTTGIFNSLNSGTYYILIKDVQQCEIVASGTIRDSDGPVIVNISSTDATCNGAKNATISVLEVNGGSGILRYSINGHNWQTGHDFYNLYAGTYTVMVKDGIGCISSQVITLTQPNAFVINPIVTNASCHGANGSVTIAAAGGSGVLAYSITEGYIFQSSNIFNIPAGNYQVIVKDAANCSGNAEFTITEPREIRISHAVLNVTCNDANNGAIITHASGGSGLLQYSINGINYSTSNVFSGLAGGLTYIVYVKDALNCITTSEVFVYQPTDLVVDSSVSDVTCSGGNNGAINLSVTGGTLPYQYQWSNGQTSQGIFNLSNGNYNVTVKDFNGCQKQLSFTIDQPQNPLIVNATTVNSSSGSTADGSIDITVTGGVSSYTYLWSNGSITEDLNGLLPGAYLVTIYDANGCITSATFIVNTTVGISNINSVKDEIKLFPNPASNFINIETENFVADQIQIINLIGQVIYTETELKNKFTINTSEFDDGVYFIKFTKDNESIIKKINVQR